MLQCVEGEMKASSSEGSYRGILDQQNAITQAGNVPGHQKQTKGGYTEYHFSSIAGQATTSLTRLVLVLFICLYYMNITGQVMATIRKWSV